MSRALAFEHVTKRYLRGGPRQFSLRDEIWHAIRASVRRGRGADPRVGTLALDDVSFEVPAGQSLALIGPNGSGKTTALKLMARITYPSAGRLRVRGSLGALIEVGSGIHPELSGRENVWLYGQILGMSRADIRRRFDEIVEFAELEHAIDTQVKLYSSGMQLRLGFSIASHLDPDIFVVDEALAVGDAGFQARCVERMAKLVREGRTLLFVSHDLAAVQATCERGIFLLDGKVHHDGPIRETIRGYLDWLDEGHHARYLERAAPVASEHLRLDGVACVGPDGGEQYAFATGDDLVVRLRFHVPERIAHPHVTVGITDGRSHTLTLCSMAADGLAPAEMHGTTTVECALHGIPLLPRVYQLWCSVQSAAGHGDLFEWQPVGAFRVAGDFDVARPMSKAGVATDGPVFVAHDWRVDGRPVDQPG